MNQGKLEVVKQKMARVNVNILGISERKWTEMGEFNSDDHYIYYCGQESLRRNGVAILVNERVQNANGRMISICFQLKPFSFFGISGWGIDLDYCDIEWFALETKRDNSVIFRTVLHFGLFG